MKNQEKKQSVTELHCTTDKNVDYWSFHIVEDVEYFKL